MLPGQSRQERANSSRTVAKTRGSPWNGNIWGMPKVIVLPDHVASQIAAGEVVERPASVVKELVENSVDSGAGQIEIAIASDCRDIRVADNGCGMEAQDAVLAFQRHATSKLSCAEDLNSLRTLGFRGEALPSIASVARVTCYTRGHDAVSGTRIEAAEGQISAREAGCAPGTVIEVCDLFYNVPARLSFLKKASTEFGHIHEIVQSLAVSYPGITFQLLNQGEVVLRTSGSGKLAQVMQEVGLLTGKEELLPVTRADLRYGMAVYGYVARAPYCRGDRKGILSIVNNRPVRCPLTYKALEYAFSDLIPRGRYPVAVLTVTIDPRQVDVNIHPTKKEIKYANSSDVYLAIQNAIRDAIRLRAEVEPAPEPANGYVQDVETAVSGDEGDSSGESLRREPLVREPAAMVLPSVSAGSPGATHQRLQQISFRDRLSYAPSAVRNLSNISNPCTSSRAHGASTLPSGWRMLGYLHNTYILVQTPDGLEIVEQHIAHERVIYERILAQRQTASSVSESSQRLVISAPLNLSPAQRACLEENLSSLRELGFDFDILGEQIACTQVPLELASKDYAASVQSNVEQLLLAEEVDFQLEASKSLACQAAIKNGMPLSESEIAELLSEWHSCERNDSCPHGRPISIKFSSDKLYQLFHPV